MPTHRPVKHLALRGGRINTYSPAFFERVEYVSDSNQHWRGKDLARILGRRPTVAGIDAPGLVAQDYTPFMTILEALAARLGLNVETDILTPERRAILPAPAA